LDPVDSNNRMNCTIKPPYFVFFTEYSFRVIKSRRMRRKGYVARMAEVINTCKILAVNPEWKIPLEMFRRRFEDNTKMDPQNIWCKTWIVFT
jgi:hypothetical protein